MHPGRLDPDRHHHLAATVRRAFRGVGHAATDVWAAGGLLYVLWPSGERWEMFPSDAERMVREMRRWAA